MRREPYILSEHMCVQEIAELIKRSYDEGYEDGKNAPKIVPSYVDTTFPTKPAWWDTPYCQTPISICKASNISESSNISKSDSSGQGIDQSKQENQRPKPRFMSYCDGSAWKHGDDDY